MASVDIGEVERDLATLSLDGLVLVENVDTTLDALSDLRRSRAGWDMRGEVDERSSARRSDPLLLQPLAKHLVPAPLASRELRCDCLGKNGARLFEEDLEQRVYHESVT